MAQKVFVVEGRQFRTESDYACAKRDKEIIDKLREKTDSQDRGQLEVLRKELRSGRYHFQTLLGQDFLDEVEMQLKQMPVPEGRGRKTGKTKDGKRTRRAGRIKGGKQTRQTGGEQSQLAGPVYRDTKQSERVRSKTVDSRRSGKDDPQISKIVQEELRKREKRRKLIIISCSVAAACCLGYFAVYSYYDYRTQSAYRLLSELKESAEGSVSSTSAVPDSPEGPLFTLDGEAESREVLEEYQKLMVRYKRLIGWVKIEGTKIDYPVMQTVDNEYYLDHNMDHQYDKNGTIFMDKDCDVLKPSTNYILYGHHMKNGRMFGQLDLYKDESYYEEHPYISFDTIYEKGTYQVMYVFRSKVYKEDEIAFKYYQFIDANGEMEFASYMEEMAAMSLYDTGVTAEFGDQLLTLSTCDYQETDCRYVVVEKKVF